MLPRCLFGVVAQGGSQSFARLASSGAATKTVDATKAKASHRTSANEDITSETSPSESLLVSSATQRLDIGHVGNFYRLQEELLPEVLKPSGSSNVHTSRGCCPGIQDEVAASRVPAIMHRSSMHALRGLLLQGSSSSSSSSSSSEPPPGGPARLLIRGPAGTGKSVALAALVEWARASGWIVMYLPSATVLTKGGYFIRRPGIDRKYDTILSAQELLRSMVQAHEKQLAAWPRALSLPSHGAAGKGGGSLLDLVNEGLATDKASVAVDAFLRLRDELASAKGVQGSPPPSSASPSRPKVLFAIDDYNALYGRTGYGRSDDDDEGEGRRRRVPLKVDDLTLASGLKLLHKDFLGVLGDEASVIVATTSSRGIAEDTRIPVAANVTEFHMPRYSMTEMAHALHWYHTCGLAPTLPTETQARGLHALTNGNAKEVRLLTPKLTLLSSGRV